MKISFTSRYLKFIIPLCMVLAAVTMRAQTTTITGTVTDSDSQVWAGATWKANLNVLGGNPVFICGGSSGQPVPRSYSGTLTSGGAFQTATVADNNCIVPAGTTWTFTMQSLTSAAPSIVGPYVITGATQAMGAVISAAITAPRFEAAHLTYAYLPVEINDPVAGTGYVNTVSNTSYLYNGISYIQTGGGGGCTGGSVTGNVSFSGQVGDFQSGCLASVGNPFSMGLSCSQAGLREIGNATTNPFQLHSFIRQWNTSICYAWEMAQIPTRLQPHSLPGALPLSIPATPPLRHIPQQLTYRLLPRRQGSRWCTAPLAGWATAAVRERLPRGREPAQPERRRPSQDQDRRSPRLSSEVRR